MAPITQASNESNHQELMDKLDLAAIPKPFRKATWKPPQRRNKNVKQIIAEASRKEASVMATQNNSGISTPLPEASHSVTGDVTPVPGQHQQHQQPNIAQAAQNLSNFVLEKNAQNGMSFPSTGPAVTYTNIESAPSLHPSSQRHYCDVTGLPAPYTDPKTRLRYHNGEMFNVVRGLTQSATEQYLSARGAHVILK